MGCSHAMQYGRDRLPDVLVALDLGDDEEDVNMKPGDLLQWIQKLNGTKG